MKKISIILILSLLFITLRVDYVKADTITDHWVENFNLARDNVQAFYDYMSTVTGTDQLSGDAYDRAKKALSGALSPLGMIIGYVTFSEQNFISLLNGKNYGGIQIGGEGATDAQVMKDTADFVYNHIQFSDNNQMILDPALKGLLMDYTNFIKDQSGYRYCYTYDIVLHAQDFDSGDKYRAFKNLCDQYQQDYLILWQNDFNIVCLIPRDNDTCGVKASGTFDNVNISVDFYNRASWENIKIAYNGSYNATTKTVDIVSINNGGNAQAELSTVYENINTMPWWRTITRGQRQTYKVYATVADMKADSVGQAPYYQSANWENYVNSNNTYTVDSSNSNNITIGDIITYNDNYYDQNGKYPDPTTINVYINNNIPTQDSGGGGGSGGGGSGGGDSGGTGDSTSIWDFLSRLGEVLGGLIKNLGNMLASLIDSIISIINDVIGKVPQVFNNLLEIVFGGLPEDLRSVIILGITIMVLYGIIKVIRG